MADDGGHLGLWGFGNNTWNVRMSATNGFLGIGAINPATRLHMSLAISRFFGLVHPLANKRY